MSIQLTLGIGLRDDATFSNFYVGRNLQVLHTLKKMVVEAGEEVVFLWGESGSGITHLLQAACHERFYHEGSAIYLDLSEMQLKPEILQDLETVGLICVDNIESVVGKLDWEEALMHLYNRVKESNTRLIIGARQLPKGLKCRLLDLKSRLAWGLVLKVQGLTREEKCSALRMRAVNRGLNLPEKTCQLLLRNYPENTTALFAALEQLDKASLAEKQKLTAPFVRRVLDDSTKREK